MTGRLSGRVFMTGLQNPPQIGISGPRFAPCDYTRGTCITFPLRKYSRAELAPAYLMAVTAPQYTGRKNCKNSSPISKKPRIKAKVSMPQDLARLLVQALSEAFKAPA
jgi:hypothetical protein